MDEIELEIYLNAINEIERRELSDAGLWESCRDEDGYAVPGCFYVKPAPFEA